MSNSLICKSQLSLAREAREKYTNDINAWNQRNTFLNKQKIELERKLKEADDKLMATEPTTRYEFRCTRDWDNSGCLNHCINAFGELRGVSSPVDGKRTKVNYEVFEPCYWWQYAKACACTYVTDADTSPIRKIIADLDNVKADITNHQNNEYPKPAPIRVECCSNEMDCRGGTCLGNLQICESIIENISSTQDEPQIFNNIKQINDTIDGMIKNIYKLIPNFINLYENVFKKKNYTDDFLSVYNLTKRIYNNIDNFYQQIYKEVQSVFQFINDLKVENGRVSATSQYKNETNNILNNLVNRSSKLMTDFRNILQIYVKIKKIYETMDKEKKNYDLMNNNIVHSDKLLISFNDNIKKIQKSYNLLEDFIIINDEDLLELNNIFNTIKNINGIIDKNIIDFKKILNENEILFDTYDTKSIFINEVTTILNKNKTIVNTSDDKYKEIINLIKDTDSIYLKKKDIYEREKKIKLDKNIYDEQKLNEIEEQNIEVISDKLVEKEVEQPMSDSNTKDGIGKLETSLIITGVAILSICLILYFLRSKPVPAK